MLTAPPSRRYTGPNDAGRPKIAWPSGRKAAPQIRDDQGLSVRVTRLARGSAELAEADHLIGWRRGGQRDRVPVGERDVLPVRTGEVHQMRRARCGNIYRVSALTALQGRLAVDGGGRENAAAGCSGTHVLVTEHLLHEQLQVQ